MLPAVPARPTAQSTNHTVRLPESPALRPETVNSFPLTMKSRVLKPETDFSVPSQTKVPDFALPDKYLRYKKKTRLTDSSFLFTGQNNRFLFHNNFQLFNNIFNVAAQSCLRHAYHMDVASIDRQQHLMGMASPYGLCHGRRKFAHHRIGA